MLYFHDIMKLCCSTSILVEPKLFNSKLPKIKQAIIDYFKKDLMNMLRTYKKMNFYPTCKTDVSRSEYFDLIKNEKHRQAVAKLPSSNHKLRIETDRYHLPKIPESLRIRQLCSRNKVENEIHFLFECNLYKNLTQHFSQDVEAEYSKFVELNKSEKVIYFFININPYVCKQLGYKSMGNRDFYYYNF